MKDLDSAEIFRDLDSRELQALREIAQERTFPAGARVFRENDPGDGIYLIREGLVEIAHLIGDHALCVFSKFGPGEVFGEMAIIDELPRSATTTAIKETRVFFIPREPMIALIRRSPTLSFALLQQASQRLRNFNQHHLREILEAERLATLGNFARSIVHDLKNSLTIISMATEMMSVPDTTPERRRASYDRIKRQIASVTEMVGDILDFTQNAPVKESPAAVSYREFIEAVVEDLQAEAQFESARVLLENEPQEVKLRFDPRRIRRVIFNLVGNAVDMMPASGQITMRFQDGEGHIITEIQDEGPGIAPEIADKLFQTFATFGKARGTGLGLSICKKIIEDHGGRISARNAPGRGAIFSFSLPVRRA